MSATSWLRLSTLCVCNFNNCIMKRGSPIACYASCTINCNMAKTSPIPAALSTASWPRSHLYLPIQLQCQLHHDLRLIYSTPVQLQCSTKTITNSLLYLANVNYMMTKAKSTTPHTVALSFPLWSCLKPKALTYSPLCPVPDQLLSCSFPVPQHSPATWQGHCLCWTRLQTPWGRAL